VVVRVRVRTPKPDDDLEMGRGSPQSLYSQIAFVPYTYIRVRVYSYVRTAPRPCRGNTNIISTKTTRNHIENCAKTRRNTTNTDDSGIIRAYKQCKCGAAMTVILCPKYGVSEHTHTGAGRDLRSTWHGPVGTETVRMPLYGPRGPPTSPPTAPSGASRLRGGPHGTPALRYPSEPTVLYCIV
jgi:hypothetical protein